MSVPMETSDPKKATDSELSPSSNWTINVDVKIRTVKVSNISLAATDVDIKEFFSFSGNIQHIEMQRESENTQLAYVTFKNSQGADTALLLSGSTIKDLPVTIAPVDNYLLPPDALSPNSAAARNINPESPVTKAEDVVSSMLAKGFILGKDALNKAKTFDERLHLTSNAAATVASIDKKIGLSEKIGMGTAVVNEKVRGVDEQFQVSEKTKLAYNAAEQKVSSASSAIMSNQYVSTGASLVSGAFSKVATAVGAVSAMTKEKLEKAEAENGDVYKEKPGVVNEFSGLHLDESPPAAPPVVPLDKTAAESKLGNI